MLNAIANYLSCMERFALGIQLKIYHIKVFKKMIGATLTTKWYDRFREVIEHFRKIHSYPTAYQVLIDFVKELQQKSHKHHCLLKIPLIFKNHKEKE